MKQTGQGLVIWKMVDYLLQTEVKCNYSDVHGVGECIVLEEFIAMTVV